jgi:hypothetical protein
MPTIYRSLLVVDNGETVSVDVDGVEVDTPVVELRALVDRDELDRIGADFDPTSPSSPLAGESREIARPIVEDWTAPPDGAP